MKQGKNTLKSITLIKHEKTPPTTRIIKLILLEAEVQQKLTRSIIIIITGKHRHGHRVVYTDFWFNDRGNIRLRVSSNCVYKPNKDKAVCVTDESNPQTL